MTLRYRTYGLSLSSDLPIPGLSEVADDAGAPDICAEFASEPSWVRQALQLPSTVLYSLPPCEDTHDPAFVLTSFGDGEFFKLAYSDGSRFVLDAAITRIWGAPGESQTLADLATYFLGPVMGYILRKRGVTALHASAFGIAGKAVALAGPAGAGKSTTAASLALRGFPILCEDIAALDHSGETGGFAIEPGYPRVCLWPDSVEMLLGHADALARITPNWEKCYLPLDGAKANLAAQKTPLGAVYILAPRESQNAPRIEEVSSPAILLELVQNTYMNWLLDRRQRAEEFELLSRLLSHTPVRRLVPHRDPARVNALCDLLLDDAARLVTDSARAVATATR